jgi:hypothetical protein
MAIAGCSDGEQLDPIPSLRLAPLATHVRGELAVRVEATPASAFHGVELTLRGQRLATDLRPPFVFTVDSRAFPDGPAELVATGILKRTGAALVAEARLSFENFAPALEIVAPADNAALTGSPRQGFRLAPVVSAADGNGIRRLWANVDLGPEVDLGAGDGSTALPLPPLGADFPADFVRVDVHAEDDTGALTSVTHYTRPSNLVLQVPLPANARVADLRALPDGDVLVGLGSPAVYGLVSERTLTAPAVPVPDGDVGPTVTLGADVFYFRPEAAGLSFLHRGGTAAPEPLFHLDVATATRAFGPVLLSANRVAVGWQEQTTHAAHVAVFSAEGAKLGDAPVTTPAGVRLGDPAIEAPDGRLVITSGTEGAPTYAIDPLTGAAGAAWPPQGATIVFSDAQGVVARPAPLPAPNTYTTTRLAAYADTVSPAVWDTTDADPGLVDRVCRGPGGSALALIDNEAGASLRRFDAGGVTTLWSAPPGASAHVLATAPDSGDLLLQIGHADGSCSVTSLHPDGSSVWAAPLDVHLELGPTSSLALADGSAIFVGMSPTGNTLRVVALGPKGVRWSAESALFESASLLEQDGLLFLAGGDAFGAQLVEARSTATGELDFRYHAATGVGVGVGAPALAWSAAWGMILTPGQLDVSAPEPLHAPNAILGLLP